MDTPMQQPMTDPPTQEPMSDTPTQQPMSDTPTQTEATQTGPAASAESYAKPTLYVCHGDEGGPRVHPCRRVQEAMHAKGIAYDKVIAGHGSPIPFLRKGSRDQLREATGSTSLPTLKLTDGTVLSHSRAIMKWVKQQG